MTAQPSTSLDGFIPRKASANPRPPSRVRRWVHAIAEQRILIAAVALVIGIDAVIVVTQLDYYRRVPGLAPTVLGVSMRVYALVPLIGEALSMFFGAMAGYSITKNKGRYRQYLRLMWAFAGIAAFVNASNQLSETEHKRAVTALVLGGLSLCAPLVWHTYTGLRIAVEVTGTSIADLARVARQWARHPFFSLRCARWVDIFPELTRDQVWEMVIRRKRERVLRKLAPTPYTVVNVDVDSPVNEVVNPADSEVDSEVDRVASKRHWLKAWRRGKRSSESTSQLVNLTDTAVNPAVNSVNPAVNSVNPAVNSAGESTGQLSPADVADLRNAYAPIDIVGELGVIGGQGGKSTAPVDNPPAAARKPRQSTRRVSSDVDAESTGELRVKALIIAEWWADHQPGQESPGRRSQKDIATARGVSPGYVSRLFTQCREGKHANPHDDSHVVNPAVDPAVDQNAEQ